MSPSRPSSKPAGARRSGKAAAQETLQASVDAAKALHFPDPVVMALDAVVPYWRNPRRINDEAVNALVASITEYGYSQPIVVDETNVIIIGHTRYTALRRMGVQQAPVVVATGLTAGQVKELRVLDNKAAEYSSWDFEVLSEELQGLNMGLMRAFFPEVGSIQDRGTDEVSESDDLPDTSAWDEVDRLAEFICPSCFHSWEMEVTLKAVKTGKLEVAS